MPVSAKSHFTIEAPTYLDVYYHDYLYSPVAPLRQKSLLAALSPSAQQARRVPWSGRVEPGRRSDYYLLTNSVGHHHCYLSDLLAVY
ncbi:hypothetical protein XA68_15760 [Ophiocordyceps unilateralis]|uniref:Uncharacterized protein n=1 Tax=Ophiocordyceps unilateralis TaxID=268505 RepID=A0A2A9P7T8_OPHUN|nr:hypothetical protein XA68_15760 [Ophiocordyceps unilateralis]